MPIALTDEFINRGEKRAQWAAFLRKSKLAKEQEWEEVILKLREFLMPITRAWREGESFEMIWRVERGWQ